uniref:Uncharacterized protein n=1 Tax=Anguilla anguilla TaxID=7936 RepID=A0A0E9VMI4_ANGAN
MYRLMLDVVCISLQNNEAHFISLRCFHSQM